MGDQRAEFTGPPKNDVRKLLAWQANTHEGHVKKDEQQSSPPVGGKKYLYESLFVGDANDSAIGVPFSVQKFRDAAHEGLDIYHREAPTAKSSTKITCSPTVALLTHKRARS